MSKFNLFSIFLISAFLFSCAPVKFSKSNTYTVTPQCTGDAGCGPSGPAIICNPKINTNSTTFSYVGSSALPNISSNCAPANDDYLWTVKRADSSTVQISVPGLIGANPQSVDFTALGPGTYYVYLTASQTGGTYSPFVAATPLEFIVGGAIGNQLTCSPTLNQTLTSVTLAAADNNALVSANCSPAAGTYTWTVSKNGVAITIAGLSGATSTPDIKSYGVGSYQISLYAASTTSQHWQSSVPLTVTVTSSAPPLTPIACNPRINGSMTTYTMNATSAYPLISANCLPTSVLYTWSATKNGNTVIIPNLSGANSNPDFLSLGVGTYQVFLSASAANYSNWNTTTPLIVTVDPTGGGMTIDCSPRLNGTAVVLSIPTTGPNPVVSSNCTPATATPTWTVFKAGNPVTIAGLSGTNSAADFTTAGLGTYYIYLTAAAAGYNTYVSPTPLEVTVSTTPSQVRTVTFQKLVTSTDNKVDILMVVDDSSSMLPDNTKLGQRLYNFVNDLTASGLDWQMCATVTHTQMDNGTMFWGLSRNWENYIGSDLWILKMGATDPYAIFTNTITAIGAGWADTDDERGIKAAWWHAEYREFNKCYRDDASLAVIQISDEDERSVGGNPAQVFYPGELKNLEGDDQPFGYVNKIKQTFGMNKRFTVNSIIVKPTDSACMAQQDADGSKSHYGFKHQELSQLTGGHVGSICDTDYSNSLYYFKDRIINSMASVPLECAPVGPITVTITPSMGIVNTQLQNNTLVFSPAITAGRTLNLKYNCPQN